MKRYQSNIQKKTQLHKSLLYLLVDTLNLLEEGMGCDDKKREYVCAVLITATKINTYIVK